MIKEIEKYYCENCFEEELKNPIEDKFGGIYCSEKCENESLEWKGIIEEQERIDNLEIDKYINYDKRIFNRR